MSSSQDKGTGVAFDQAGQRSESLGRTAQFAQHVDGLGVEGRPLAIGGQHRIGAGGGGFEPLDQLGQTLDRGGDLVGGSDIILEMFEKGELQTLIKSAVGKTEA